jgi:hypothetical protein
VPRLLDSTESLYEDAADRMFREQRRSRGSRTQALGRRRVFRATEVGSVFPADRMLPALEGTLRASASTCARRRTSTSTSRSGPNKSPRAFCAPIEVPGQVMLVIQPIGGPDDWRALFHEAGHTEHFATHVARLSVEERASATARSPRAGRCCSST